MVVGVEEDEEEEEDEKEEESCFDKWRKGLMDKIIKD